MPFYNDHASRRLDYAASEHLDRVEDVIRDETIPLTEGRELHEVFDRAIHGLTNAVVARADSPRAAAEVVISGIAHTLGVQLASMPRDRWGAALAQLRSNILACAEEAAADEDLPTVGQPRQ